MGTRQNRRYIFGKDEVGGSNPPSSSRKALNLKGFGAFLFGGRAFGRPVSNIFPTKRREIDQVPGGCCDKAMISFATSGFSVTIWIAWEISSSISLGMGETAFLEPRKKS